MKSIAHQTDNRQEISAHSLESATVPTFLHAPKGVTMGTATVMVPALPSLRGSFMNSRVALVAGFFLLVFSVLCWSEASPTTIRGTVKEVSHTGDTGTHVWLNSGGKEQEVCLGDSRVLRENGLVPKIGDVVEVTGVKGGRVFVADMMRVGGRTLDLQPSNAASYTHHRCGYDCGDHNDGHHHCSHGDRHHGHE